MYYIEEDTIESARDQIVRLVMDVGVTAERRIGEKTVELDAPLEVLIKKPYESRILKTPTNFEAEYYKTVCEARQHEPQFSRSDGKFIGHPYTYGNRIRAFEDVDDYYKVDQLDEVIEKLKENMSTRQAVITLNNPFSDSSAADIPCMQYIQFLLNYRNYKNQLDVTAVFRSNDMLQAWPYNAGALANLLRIVADCAYLDPGYVRTISICPHIYSHRDATDIKKIMK